MAINFDLSRLTSRVVRSSAGTRIIGGAGTGISNGTGNEVLDGLFKGIGYIGGFLGKIVDTIGVKFSWSGLWSWCVAAKQFVWNFNWNATDEELQASIDAQWKAIAAQIGGSLGNAFGYFACGILPGAAIFAFNEPLGAYVLEQVGEEMLEELIENLNAVLNSALRLGTQILLTETYKNVRKLIKSNSNLVGKLFGKDAEKATKAWGTKDSKPWSFASATDEFLDNVLGSDTWQREFAEEFLEEADEACVEAGYVVANSVDTWLSSQMLARHKAPVLGNERYVEITPNRNNPDERVVLGGSEELLKPVIIQYLATHEQFNGRDLGIVYGTVAADMPERKHRPEVVLKFYRKQNNSIEKGVIQSALSMQIAFRLMDKSVKDFATNEYLGTLASAIYREFATPPFEINKGLATYTYADFEKGYQFKLDVINSAEAKRIIKKVQDIQGHPFRDECFRVGSRKITSDGAYQPPQTKPDKVTLRGNIVELPLKDKGGIVKFTHAYLNLGIQVPPIDLVDMTGKKKNVVYSATKNTSP